ncbi:hypothetical protein PV-S19_0221 [Pacmanvirus S19]|nr:hypothetical protein PV-S19_0221 [Pacmanvirus S19]
MNDYNELISTYFHLWNNHYGMMNGFGAKFNTEIKSINTFHEAYNAITRAYCFCRKVISNNTEQNDHLFKLIALQQDYDIAVKQIHYIKKYNK